MAVKTPKSQGIESKPQAWIIATLRKDHNKEEKEKRRKKVKAEHFVFVCVFV